MAMSKAQKFQTLEEFYDSTPEKHYAVAIKQANPMVFRSFREYALQGRKAGSFVSCVIIGDFFRVHAKADDKMKHVLHEVAMYFANCVPYGAYGSEKALEEWIDEGGLVGSMGVPKALEIAERKSL